MIPRIVIPTGKTTFRLDVKTSVKPLTVEASITPAEAKVVNADILSPPFNEK